MQKLQLISIMIMTLVIPIMASKEKTRQAGVKKTVKWMAGYCALYLFELVFVYPRLEGR